MLCCVCILGNPLNAQCFQNDPGFGDAYVNYVIWMDQSFIDQYPNPSDAASDAQGQIQDALSPLHDIFWDLNVGVVYFNNFFTPTTVAAPSRQAGESNASFSSRIRSNFSTNFPCLGSVYYTDLIIYVSYGPGFGYTDSGTGVNITAHNIKKANGDVIIRKETIVHEVGHYLGFIHPGDDPSLPCYDDCVPYTFMCPSASFLVQFNNCDRDQLASTNGVYSASNCAKWKDAAGYLDSNFDDCPNDYPSVSIVSDIKYLSDKTCAENYNIATFKVTIRGGNIGCNNAKLRVFFSDKKYDWDGLAIGLGFQETIPDPNEMDNLILIRKENGQEVIFNLAPEEVQTYTFKLKFNPDVGVDPTTLLSTRVSAKFTFDPVYGYSFDEAKVHPVAFINYPAMINFGMINPDVPMLIDENTTIRSSLEIMLNVPAILVTNGARIDIDGATTLSSSPKFKTEIFGCTTMWEGIRLTDPNAKLKLDNVTIKDAQFGISTFTASQIQVTNSKFINNNFGIYVALSGNSPNSPNLTLLGNSHYTLDNGLLPAYTNQWPLPLNNSGYAGVYVNGVKNGFNLGGSATDDKPYYFANLYSGLVAINSNVSVSNVVIQDLNVGFNPSQHYYPGSKYLGTAVFARGGLINLNATPIKPILIKNCFSAIEAQNTDLTASGVEMIEVSKGIVGNNLKSCRIKQNTINATSQGISLFFPKALSSTYYVDYNNINMHCSSPSSLGWGIRIGDTDYLPYTSGSVAYNTLNLQDCFLGIAAESASSLKINTNTINSTGVPGAGLHVLGGEKNAVNCNTLYGNTAYGIYGLMSGQTDFTCNTINGANNGLDLNGVFVGGTSNIAVKGNVLQNNASSGMHFGSDALVGAQVHQGNRWKGGSALTTAVHDGPFSLVQQSLFTVDAAEDAEFLPIDINPSDWFFNQSDGSPTDVCNTSTVCPFPIIPGRRIGALDRSVALGQIPGLAHPEFGLWLAQRRLYTRLTEDANPYATDADFVAFLQNNQESSAGRFAQLNAGMRQTFNVSPVRLALLDTLQAQVAAGFDTLAQVETQLFAYGISSEDSVQWTHERTDILDDLEVNLTNLDSLQQVVQTERKTALLAIGATLTNLPDTTNYEYCEKTVAALFLQMVLADSVVFSASQINELDSIAHLCPLSEGEAVLRARSMLAAYDTTQRVYDDEMACESSLPRHAAQKVQKSLLSRYKIYPNPAQDVLILEYINNSEVGDHCKLFNPVGQLMREINLPNLKGTARLEVSNLPEGMYYIAIGNGFVKKVVIQH